MPGSKPWPIFTCEIGRRRGISISADTNTNIHSDYQLALRASNTLDFDDLLVYWLVYSTPPFERNSKLISRSSAKNSFVKFRHRSKTSSMF